MRILNASIQALNLLTSGSLIVINQKPGKIWSSSLVLMSSYGFHVYLSHCMTACFGFSFQLKDCDVIGASSS